jgi:mersacidin/lichenicidin family type 2 lantibiotic
MSNQDIIRAWKDEDYRLSLSEAERALLPEHPAGLIELAGAEIDGVDGGTGGINQLLTNTLVWWICHGGPPPR